MQNQKWLYFVTIAEICNITKAAEKLYLTQPSLSKYLSRLENDLQVQLFDRGHNPLKLTDAGEVYFRYAQQQLQIEEQLHKELALLKDVRSGYLRIGIGNWRGTYMLPELLPVFSARYPAVEVQIKEGTTVVLLDALSRGETDLCITSVDKDQMNLDYRILGSERILLAGGNKHPFVEPYVTLDSHSSSLPNIDLSELQNETFLLTTRGQNFAKVIEEYLEQMRIAPAAIMRIENLTTGVHLAAQGKSFAFLPEAGLKSHTHALPSSVTYFTIGQPELTFDIAIAHKKNARLSWAAQAFVDTISKYCRETFFSQLLPKCGKNANTHCLREKS